MPLAAVLVLVLFVVVAAAPRAARAASPQLRATRLPCPAPEQLLPRLEALLADDALAAGEDLVVELEPARPGTLLVRMTRGTAVFDRALAFDRADCPLLPDIVDELVRGWLGQPWSALAEAAALVPQRPPTPSAPAAFPPTVYRPASPRPTRPPQWRLSLAGGSAIAPGSGLAPSPSARLGAEWDRSERWGLGLVAGFDGGTARAMGSGSLSIAGWSLALVGRFSLRGPFDASSRLDLIAGPALRVLDARARGVTRPASERVPDAAALLQVRWRQPLAAASPLALFAAVAASLGAPQQFGVGHVSETLTLPAVRGEAVLGLALSL